MGGAVATAAALCCLLAAIVAPRAAAETTEITLGQGTHASALTAGRDGNLWFVGTRSPLGGEAYDVVGRASPSGALTEFPLPPRPAGELGLDSIVAARDGYLYFTETGAGRIGRMSTGGQFDDFALPTPGSRPRSIVEAPDGKLWIAEEGVDRVASIDNLSGIVSEYRLISGAHPRGVAARAEGTVWVTETGLAKLGTVSPDKSVRSFELRDHASRPNEIVPGPEGNLWFTDLAKPRLGRVTWAAGTQGEYEWLDLPWGSSTGSIVYGPAGDFWYTTGNRIGSVSTSWGLARPACLAGGCAQPISDLAVGPEGDLWYGTAVRRAEGGGSAQREADLEAGTIGIFEPPPLEVQIAGAAGRLAGRYVSLDANCAGGAAGQRCDAKIRVLGRLRSERGRSVLGRAAVYFRTATTRPVRLRLSAAAAATLAGDGRLAVRVKTTVKGGKPTTRRLVLRGPARNRHLATR